MANFLAIIDSNPERRARYIDTIKKELAPIESLAINSAAIGDFCIVWANSKNTSVSIALEQKSGAVVFGRPVSDNQKEEIGAGTLLDLWSNDEKRLNAFYNGFYAGIVYSIDKGLTAGADLLGIYPVYYWSSNNVLLAGSSPELFKYHPYFSAQLNPEGLISILLTTHIFDGQTLFKGVKRLQSGCILRFENGKEAKEEVQYKIKPTMKYYDLPFSAHLEILNDAIENTMSRHVPAKGKYSLLLSGGLDSRMLAGFLQEQNIDFDAITMGLDSDIEMQTARKVVKSLGIKQNKIEVEYEQYASCGENLAKWEHISNGFNDIFNWGYCRQMRNYENLVLGHSFDAVIGTRYINWAYSSMQKKMSFDTFFENVNKWGIKPEVLKRLFGNSAVYNNMIDEIIQKIRNTYESYSEIESQRAWCFNLYNRQRFHVGSSAFTMSFGALPIMPAIDRKLLECAAAIPAASIAERRAQTELLCSRFPKLARLPIDRNSYDTTPLKPRVRYLAGREFYRLMKKVLSFSKNVQSEHRYYYRIYDFDNKGWKAVRREAEPYRKKIYDIFDKEELNKLLPRPEEQANLKENIADASGYKLLTGIMLWSKGNL
ncbi:MAG: asparagine synthase-related protein [Phycisphaerales bacterium]